MHDRRGEDGAWQSGQFRKLDEEEIQVSHCWWHKQRKRGREENEFSKVFSGNFSQNPKRFARESLIRTCILGLTVWSLDVLLVHMQVFLSTLYTRNLRIT